MLCSGDVNDNADLGENVEPTDKMRYAEKFNRSGEADIKLVWEEWFWDCLEFGGGFHLTVSTCIHTRYSTQVDLTKIGIKFASQDPNYANA